MEKSHIEQLIQEAIENRPDLFLVDFQLSIDNLIRIFVDADYGVSLKDCISISRYIEERLDREKEDFSLEVSSVGLESPLIFERQYIKNIGKEISVETKNGESYRATLTQVKDKAICLQWYERVKKPIGKGKITQMRELSVPIESIERAVITIKI